MGVIVKNYAYTYEGVHPVPVSSLRHGVNVIKRQWINYSVPQLVRMGMLPLSAYEEYERTREEESGVLAGSSDEFMENLAAEEALMDAEETPVEEKPRRGAFWESDDGERELMSEADFAKFLAESGISL